MRKILNLIFLSLLCVALCSCGEAEKVVEKPSGYGIDGKYITDTAYGMEDFYSEITVNGNAFELYIEHYDVPVEEYSGTFEMEGSKILFKGEEELEFEYNPEERTIYNDVMETLWVIEDNFVPSKEQEGTEQSGEEPDPVPESVRGDYVYSDDFMTATLTINEGDYRQHATSEGGEPLQVTGDVAYAGAQILLMEDGNSITCPLDEQKGTIVYEGYTFKKQ